MTLYVDTKTLNSMVPALKAGEPVLVPIDNLNVPYLVRTTGSAPPNNRFKPGEMEFDDNSYNARHFERVVKATKMPQKYKDALLSINDALVEFHSLRPFHTSNNYKMGSDRFYAHRNLGFVSLDDQTVDAINSSDNVAQTMMELSERNHIKPRLGDSLWRESRYKEEYKSYPFNNVNNMFIISATDLGAWNGLSVTQQAYLVAMREAHRYRKIVPKGLLGGAVLPVTSKSRISNFYAGRLVARAVVIARWIASGSEATLGDFMYDHIDGVIARGDDLVTDTDDKNYSTLRKNPVALALFENLVSLVGNSRQSEQTLRKHTDNMLFEEMLELQRAFGSGKTLSELSKRIEEGRSQSRIEPEILESTIVGFMMGAMVTEGTRRGHHHISGLSLVSNASVGVPDNIARTALSLSKVATKLDTTVAGEGDAPLRRAVGLMILLIAPIMVFRSGKVDLVFDWLGSLEADQMNSLLERFGHLAMSDTKAERPTLGEWKEAVSQNAELVIASDIDYSLLFSLYNSKDGDSYSFKNTVSGRTFIDGLKIYLGLMDEDQKSK